MQRTNLKIQRYNWILHHNVKFTCHRYIVILITASLFINITIIQNYSAHLDFYNEFIHI